MANKLIKEQVMPIFTFIHSVPFNAQKPKVNERDRDRERKINKDLKRYY
jgi:hypothetical protein